jgi:hypothetical protein
MDSDPDPAIFVTDLQDGYKKLITNFFFCLLLFVGAFQRKKSKKVAKRNQGFSYYFCFMIEGSGSGGPKTCVSGGSGSGTLVPSYRNRTKRLLTNGSGSGS